MVSQIIAHYRIAAKIDVGGPGEVYHAYDTQSGRHVAIRILPVSLAPDERLLHEIRIVSLERCRISSTGSL